MATKSYQDFKEKYLGKRVDVDGFPASQPYQCWDYVSGLYFPYIGGKVIHCGQSGYVKDIANQRNSNGILDFCVDVGLKATLQPGDICIWTNCPACPYSHIAIYDHDDGQDAVFFIGQNQSATYVNIIKIPVAGIIGVFRPKIFVGKKEDAEVKQAKKKKKPDQILTKGSKVISEGFYIQKINYQKDWGYNSWVGGWFPLKDVDEVDALDGRKDQIVHIGSGCAFNKGVMTVIDINVKNDTALCKELGYWVKSRCLREVED